MKKSSLPGAPLDVTLFIEAAVDSLRVRLPLIVAAEVAKQLADAQRSPRMSDAELRARNLLRTQNGLPALPGAEPAPAVRARPRGEALDKIAAIRAREP